MKIVILDGYTINPGDLDWKSFEKLGETVVYDRTLDEQTHERALDADAVITSKVPFSCEMLERLPKLKYIGVIATGFNVIDVKTAKENGIVVTNVPDYCKESVAQLVIGHILELSRRIGDHDKSIRKGNWSAQPDFCYWDHPQIELNRKTLGLLGSGNIGQEVAKIAHAMGMKIIAYDVRKIEEDHIEQVEMDELLKRSDVLSLHCPLTDATMEIIRKENLNKMKKTAFLVNTSRGPLVNDKDLADALNNGTLAGAALDVLSVEPPDMGNPLLKSKNTILTPHIGWSSFEARERLIRMTAGNLEAFINGNPVNVVN